MKNKFLYIKQVNKIGYLDDSLSFEDSLWYITNEYDEYIKKINETKLEDFIAFFISLFELNMPNANRLLSSFSDEVKENKNKLITQNNISREDISSISVEFMDKIDLNSIKFIEIIFKEDLSNIFQKLDVEKLLRNNLLKKIKYDASKKQIVFQCQFSFQVKEIQKIV